MILEAKNIVRKYSTLEILKGIDITIEHKEVVFDCRILRRRKNDITANPWYIRQA